MESAMLIYASLSGIQDFVFTIPHTGGGQARALRARSARVQLIAECLALHLLDHLGLIAQRKGRLLQCAAGALVIDASDAQVDDWESLVCAAEAWLLHNTSGLLRLALVHEEQRQLDRPFPERLACILDRGRAARLHPWRTIAHGDDGWLPDRLGLDLLDPEAEADRDRDMGRRLTEDTWLWFTRSQTSPDAPFGVAISSGPHAPPPDGNLLAYRHLSEHNRQAPGLSETHWWPRPVARHVPTADRRPVEFKELAAFANGSHNLGVLKIDVDNLGVAFSSQPDADACALLSRRLDVFFSERLDQYIRQHFPDTYVIFAGGDDALLVAPWDQTLDLAGKLQSDFTAAFPELTLSAGMAIIKPSYPIRLAATQAEDLLHRAKTELAQGATSPKNQCAALGGIWSWSDHNDNQDDARRAAEWVQQGIIKRGWLNHMLALLHQAGGATGADPSHAGHMAAYHVGRNWPRPDDRRPDKAAAGRWAAELATACSDPADENWSHHTTILRYALLATRA